MTAHNGDTRIDAQAVRDGADLAEIVGRYVDLRNVGSEWLGLCPFHGEKTPSFRVVPRKQFCHCFGCGWHGDAIDLIQQLDGVSFREACERLGAKAAPVERDRPKPRPRPPERITGKPPANAGMPNMRSREFGDPVKVWTYRDANGDVLGYVARYEYEEDGERKKLTPQWTWGQRGDGRPGWAMGHWSRPRPLYGLDRLAGHSDVLICEGEKATDAGADLLPSYAAVSWPGGGQAVDFVDWQPLAGRKIVIFPDADRKTYKNPQHPRFGDVMPWDEQPGWVTAQRIARILHDLGCKVRVVDTRDMAEQCDGWDLADAIAAGWDKPRLLAYARPRTSDWHPPTERHQPAAAEAKSAVVVDLPVQNRRGESPIVRQLDYVLADQLSLDDEQFDDEIIEGTIGRGSMAVLYGDSNSGKTFAAIDMAASVCRGTPWLGRSCEAGMVVYLATESPTSVEMRLRAYQRHHGVRVPGFVIVRSPINLFDGQADVTAVISLVAELETEHGTKASLIIGDTLSRLSAGANENAGEDMGVVVQHIDAVRKATGAAFLVIHHTGKDAAKGMRGWSGLRAATDTEIEVTADEATGSRTAEITKQRDLPGKGDRIGFKLEPIVLGTNKWGNQRSSCVVIPAEAAERQEKAKRPSEIAGAITEFLTQRGAGCLRGALAKHFDDRYRRSSVYREIDKLLQAGLLIEVSGIIALPGAPGANAP